MIDQKPSYEELEKRITELESRLKNSKTKNELSFSSMSSKSPSPENKIIVNGIEITWNVNEGTCKFEGLPVAWMWVDTTLAGFMSGMASMVGPERFALALQAEGRKSVESDWEVISVKDDFREGFKGIALIAAIAGWGDWHLYDYQPENKKCTFRVFKNWEGAYQKALGVCWGSGLLAGKFAGYCSKLFNTNCWAKQTKFIAKNDAYDEFDVIPSTLIIEEEIGKLLLSDKATLADLSVAYQKILKNELELTQYREKLEELVKHRTNSLQIEIAERKKAEEALKKSEEHLRLIVDGTLDYIFRLKVNDDGSVVMDYISENYYTITGRSISDIQHTDSWKDIVHPDDSEQIYNSLSTMLKTGKRIHTECRSLLNNQIRFVEINAFPLVEEFSGKLTNILGAVKDITYRKKAEEALKESETKYRKLSATKDKFFSIISHDLINPFNALIGFSNLLTTNLHEYDIEKIQKIAEQMYSVSKNTYNLLENLLEWARSQSGEIWFKPEPLLLNSVFKKIISNLNPFAIAKEITIKSIPDAEIYILADRNMLETILRNLLTNAIKYSHNGGIVCISAKEDTHRIEIAVSDDGIGMNKEEMNYLFQLGINSKSGTAKEKGTGLGLILCKEFIEKHGGKIWAKSKFGAGSEFKFTLPKNYEY